ncbi:MAG: hypothetical protein KJ888_20240, partial [Gammaproteobacteria bacterium]|nr:hypothetical protein [Gammaproteobacteria bacterium]
MTFRKPFLLFLSFFFITTSIFADPVGLLNYPNNQIMGFRGLDTTSSDPTIADSRASDLLNVKLSKGLDLKKRYGYSVINDTLDDYDLSSPAITGIFDTLFSDGTSHTIAFIGNKIKYDNSGTWTEVSTTYASPTLTAGANYHFQCIMALDSAVCTNDQDVPVKVSSTPAKSALDVSDLTDTLTKARTLTWYRNYLILGNTVEASTERPTRFRWSNVGTIETWDDDDFVDIATFAGDEIVGFFELYGELYIILTKSIWKASLVGGDDVFTFRKVVDGIGAISTYSIKVVHLSENRVAAIFLDELKRVLMFDGTVVIDIGQIIQPTLDTMNESRLSNFVSTFDGKSYYLSISDSSATTNDVLYEFQTEIGEWTTHSQIDANAMAQVKESDGSVKTYFGNNNGFVYWLNNPNNTNDVDGATGIVDSVETINTTTETGAQAIVDATIATGTYTGALMRITSGTAVGEEAIVLTNLDGNTGVVVSSAFSTTPDSTSVYSIGDINA